MTARGRRDATALGQRLAGGVPLPGLDDVPIPQAVVCSAAVRTRQTADLVVKAMGDPVELDAYHSLYSADPDIVLSYLREIDEAVQSLLLVGHNPTMYQLVWELLADGDGEGPGSEQAALEAHGFPTCALAVLALEVEAWEDATQGCARLLGLFKPPY